MKINRILIVGYGSMGRRRIRLVSEIIPEADIVCVDTSSDRRRQALGQGYRVCEDLIEGIRHSPDIAFVCISPGNHAEVILRLLSSGIHVFTELNLTSNKYDRIREASLENHAKVFFSSTLIYKRQMALFHDIVARHSQPLTYIYHVGQYLPDWHPWESYKDFFVSRIETNAIREMLAIQLPWIIHTFGKIEKFNVLVQRCTELDLSFPDVLVLSFEHENGHVGSVVLDVVSRKAITHLEIIGEECHILWNGHNDDLYKLNLDTKEFEKVDVYSSDENISGYADTISEEPYRDEIKAFLNVIEGGKTKYGIDEDAYVLSIIDQIEDFYL